ncbi:MAG: epoxide hydrolase family protein [Acidimicrobiia bacterium]
MNDKANFRVQGFEIRVDDRDLDDLRDRLTRTRWPDAETVDDWTQGVPLSYMRELCRYWANDYDWRASEKRLNAFPHFKAEVDGLGIHFIHARSPHRNAFPLVLTHGWPGSVVEFMKVIGPLVDPVAHGGDAADAFDIVCPSLPGYGFSDKPTGSGWGLERIADAWATLMNRLGYARYGAQGGDWGSAVTSYLGIRDPQHCAGIHLNMLVGRPDPSTFGDLTDEEQQVLASLKHYSDIDSGYAKLQCTRPQTIGYALADSPAAQAAWIMEKFWAWTDCNGHPEKALSRDEMLDDITLYWLTDSGASSARLYWESAALIAGAPRPPVTVPTGFTKFPCEIMSSSRRWAQGDYPNITYWNHVDKGGHFAAFEQPELFVNEVRSFFRTIR